MPPLDPASTLFWITIAKLAIGCSLFGILVGAVYKFRMLVFTVMGGLLLSNLFCLYLIMLMTAK